MKILLAIDDSPPSAHAIRQAVTQTWPEGTQFRVFSSIELPTPPGYVTELAVMPLPVTLRREAEDHARGMCASVCRMLQSRGLNAEWSTRVGAAGRSIVEEAEEWGADLILLGSHGYRGLKRLWMGSVARWVVDHAKCSVEIARAPEAPAAEADADHAP